MAIMETAMTFDAPRRLINQEVVVRDRTGAEHRGFVREVHADVLILANGDGSVLVINREGANVASVRILPPRG